MMKVARTYHREPKFNELLVRETELRAPSIGIQRAATEFVLSPCFVRSYEDPAKKKTFAQELANLQAGAAGLQPLAGPAGPAGPAGAGGPHGASGIARRTGVRRSGRQAR